MASTLDSLKRKINAGQLKTTSGGTGGRDLSATENRIRRNLKYGAYMERVNAGEVLETSEIDEMRKSRGDTASYFKERQAEREREQAIKQSRQREKLYDLLENRPEQQFYKQKAQLAARNFDASEAVKSATEKYNLAKTAYDRLNLDFNREESDEAYAARMEGYTQTSGGQNALSAAMKKEQSDKAALDAAKKAMDDAQRELATAERRKLAGVYEHDAYSPEAPNYRGAQGLNADGELGNIAYFLQNKPAYEAAAGSAMSDRLSAISYMTEDQKSTFLRLMSSGDKKSAQAYFDAILPDLTQEQYAARQAEIDNMSKPMQVLRGMGNTFAAPAAYAQVGIDTIMGRDTDLSTGAAGATRLSQYARGKSLENAGAVGKFMGDVGYSMADNLVTMALGPIGARIWLGLSAGGSSAIGTLESGASQGKALGKGTATGAIEAITEGLGLDNLFRTAKSLGKAGVKSILLSVAKQAGAEGAEEIISEFSDAVVDIVGMGADSEYRRLIQQYKDKGMTDADAKRQATIDTFVTNPALAGLAGAVSGALFGAGGTAISLANTSRSATEIKALGAVGDIVAEGLNLPANSEGYKLAQKIESDMRVRGDTDGHMVSASDLMQLTQELPDSAITQAYENAAARMAQEEEAARQQAETQEVESEETPEVEDVTETLEAEAMPEQEDAPDATVPLAAQEQDMPEMEASRTDTVKNPVALRTEDRINFKRTARGILESLGSKDTTDAEAEISQGMSNLYEVLADNGGDTNDKAFSDAGLALMNQVKEYTQSLMESRLDAEYESADEDYVKAVRRDLREVKLSVPASVRSDITDYGDFKRRNFGRLNLVAEGTAGAVPIDTKYQELSGRFPGIFSESITNQADQLQEMARFFTERASRSYSQDTSADIERQASQYAAKVVSAVVGTYRDNAKSGGVDVLADMRAQAEMRKSVYESGRSYTKTEIGRLTAESAAGKGVDASTVLEVANVAANLGVKVEFKALGKGINGYYNRHSGVIVLNAALETKGAVWTVFSHELVHHCENTGAYDALKTYVKSAIGMNAKEWALAVKKCVSTYKAASVFITNSSAESEVVAAYLSQKLLNSKEALAGIAESSPDAAKGVLSGVESILDRTTENGYAFTQEQKDLVFVQKTLAAALGERSAKRYNAQDVVSDVLPAGAQASVSFLDIDDLIAYAKEEYGKLSPGEQLEDADNPEYHTNIVELPSATRKGTQTRKTFRTIAEAPSTTRTLTDIERSDIQTVGQYTPQSNADSVKLAQEKRGKYKSLDAAAGALREYADQAKRENGATMVAFAEQLLLEAQKAEDVDTMRGVLADLSFIMTDAGQRVQAMKIYKRLSPEGKLYRYKRIGERIAKDMSGVTKPGKTTQAVIDAQAAVDAAADAIDRLNAINEEIRRGKISEAEAKKQRAEIEKKIEAAKQALEKTLQSRDSEYDKLLKRKAELAKALQDKKLSAAQLAKYRAELKSVSAQINKLEQKILDNLEAIKNGLPLLERKRKQLVDKIEEEGRTRAERNQLRKELKSIEAQIETKKKQIDKLAGEISLMYGAMETGAYDLVDIKAQKKRMDAAKEITEMYLRYAKDKGAAIVIPTDLQNELMNAKDDKERDAVCERIEQAIADQLPGTKAEKARAWRYLSMLLNPTTHLRNILGNVGQYALRNMKNILGAPIEAMFLPEGERTKAILTLSAADKALVGVARKDFNLVREDLQAGGKYEDRNSIEDKRRIFRSKGLEWIRRKNMGALEGSDLIFKKNAYISSFAQYLKANKIDAANVTEDQTAAARKYAFQEALKATYTDASKLAETLNRLEKQSPALGVAVGATIPFKKTPINILKRGVEYSPIGLIRGIADLSFHVRNNKVSASQAIDEFCAGFTGSMVFALGMYLASAGILSATPPDDDPERKKNMDTATGAQNYSIKIFGGTYTIDWLVPAVMPLMAGAELMEMIMGEKKTASFARIAESLSNVMNPVFELSMMDGLVSALASYSSSAGDKVSDIVMTMIDSYFGQYIPTFLGKIARTVDPTRRSTYAKSDSDIGKPLEKFVRRTISKIPFASRLLEPVVNQYGEEDKNFGSNWLGRLAYNMLSPGYYKESTAYEADEEMKRLYKQNGDTSVLPKKIPTSVQHEGVTYYLTPEQYTSWGKTLGTETYKAVNALYASEEYRAMSDDEKAEAVADAIKGASDTAKLQWMDSIGVLEDYQRKTIEASLYGEDRQKKPSEFVESLYTGSLVDVDAVFYAYKSMSGMEKTQEKIGVLLSADLTDDEKAFVYSTRIAEKLSEDAAENLKRVLDSGVTMNEFLQTKIDFYDAENSKEKTTQEKALALLKSDLTPAKKAALFYPYVTDSETRRGDMTAALKAGISATQFIDVYAKYSEINANEDMLASDKAVELSRYINRSYSGLSEAKRGLLADSLSYYYFLKADAGKYAKFYSSGVSEKAAYSLSQDISSLKPIAGKTQVLDSQKYTAIAANSTATEAEKRTAILDIIGDSEKSRAKFDACMSAGMTVAQYAKAAAALVDKEKTAEQCAALNASGIPDTAKQAYYMEHVNPEGKEKTQELVKAGVTMSALLTFYEKTSGLEADKDKNGKSITDSKRKKVLTVINSLPISNAAKDALYFANNYAKSRLNEAPWR